MELGDIIRLGRIEYRVIEYQDANKNRFSLFDLGDDMVTAILIGLLIKLFSKVDHLSLS